jgi:hypothetical protein
MIRCCEIPPVEKLEPPSQLCKSLVRLFHSWEFCSEGFWSGKVFCLVLQKFCPVLALSYLKASIIPFLPSALIQQ